MLQASKQQRTAQTLPARQTDAAFDHNDITSQLSSSNHHTPLILLQTRSPPHHQSQTLLPVTQALPMFILIALR